MFRPRRVLIVLCIIVILLISNMTLLGQPNYYFKHYNINNGLSQNTVLSIAQDNLGFMWFGTKDGLNRFDGYNFEIFRFSPNGELNDNVFKRIIQDNEDNIWLATDDGVYIYNTHQQHFKRFKLKTKSNLSIEGVVNDMIMDNDGDIWISKEEGVFQYHSKSKELSFFQISTRDGGMKSITLCKGSDNDIWVFPYQLPFLRINKKNKNVEMFELLDDKELFYNTGEITDVILDNYNQLLIGTSQQGLIQVNTIKRTHKILLKNDREGQPIFIRKITRIDNNKLWIGSESGIYIYNTLNENYENIRHHNNIPYSISDNAIYSIFKDKDNGIWVGSYFGGVDYYSNKHPNFELFYPLENSNSLKGSRVREFIETPEGNILIGTEDDGLNLFDPKTNEFLTLPKPLKNIYTNVHSLLLDGDYIWISNFSNGLNRYNFKTRKLITYTHSDNPNSINDNSTFAICKDSQGKLWIGTLSGLNIYNYDTDQFSQIGELDGVFVNDIKEDSRGYIWIGTMLKGLYRYNPKDQTYKRYKYNKNDPTSLCYNKVLSIFEDSERRLWITTQGGGFCRFNYKNNSFKTYNTLDGLPNNVVYQILEDDNGFLWISTNQGISKFDFEKKVFNNFTINNGLRTNQFNYKSSYKASNGALYFGSVDGFIRFDPPDFDDKGKQVPIIFTDISINNIPANVSQEASPLEKNIQYTNEFALPHNRNSFLIQYAVIDYSGINVNEIFYKLEGFDKEWINAKGNRDVKYSNLNPGKYILTVKANKDSEFESSKSLIITIKPPLWLTPWAYVLYILIILYTLFLVVKYFKRLEQKKNKERMRVYKQEKERELYRSKIDFFTNVAHEIRTPLSLIKAPLEQVLSKKDLSCELKENMEIMSKNTNRLLQLTNQLLDFRKTESDAYTLNLRKHNVTQLLQETISRFIPFAEQEKISISTEFPDVDIIAKIDKEAFIKIISNLLNNALKYGDQIVNIKLKTFIHKDEDSLHITIENDGNIIPEEKKKEIFNPFYHSPRNKLPLDNGTGIGLTLAKSLAELHKGSLFLEVINNLNCFHLILPLGKIKNIEDLELDVSTSSNNPNILIIEDDMEMNEFLTKILKEHYTVFSTVNGKEGLEILKKQVVNLIVSDVMMPEMDGFELTKKIKSDIEFSHIPIVLLTAKTNSQSKIKGYKIGADAYVEKPFSLNVLLAQINNLLENRKKILEAFHQHPFIAANSTVQNKSDKEFIIKLDNIIHQNLSETNFHVEDIAEQFNMSRASFYRKIKGVLGLTPTEYIKLERLKKAAQLLKDGNHKINEVSYLVGFNSPSYFTKCFQKQFGVLPKDFL